MLPFCLIWRQALLCDAQIIQAIEVIEPHGVEQATVQFRDRTSAVVCATLEFGNCASDEGTRHLQVLGQTWSRVSKPFTPS